MSDTSLVHRTDSNAPPPPAPLTAAEINSHLDYAMEQLRARRDVLIAALLKSYKAFPVINDDDALGEVAENVRMGNTLNGTGETRRVEQKKPFLDGGRTIDAWFRAWAVPLDKALDPVQAAMDDYAARKLAKEEADAAAAQKLADEQAEAAQLAASEALRKAKPAAVVEAALDRVAETAAVSEAADARASARPADLTRSTGIYGAVSSARRTWSWEVSDATLVPRQYLMVNPEAIKVAAKSRDAKGKPTAQIPGIRWVSTVSMGTR
jgi:hypothetical protein